MGGGRKPGSTGRHDGGPADDVLTDEALNPLGRGEYDPVTGIWDWYADPPAGEEDEGGEPISWEQLAAQRPLIVADFASEYGIRLIIEPVTWVEYVPLLHGLLRADTRLYRRFAPKHDDDPSGGDDDD